MRLDQAIAARFPEILRRKARKLIAQNRVLVNERRVAVASREVADSDRITIVSEECPSVILNRVDGEGPQNTTSLQF